MTSLDVTIPHSVMHKRVWKSIPKVSLDDMYTKRRIHIMGWNATVEWDKISGVQKDCYVTYWPPVG